MKIEYGNEGREKEKNLGLCLVPERLCICRERPERSRLTMTPMSFVTEDSG